MPTQGSGRRHRLVTGLVAAATLVGLPPAGAADGAAEIRYLYKPPVAVKPAAQVPLLVQKAREFPRERIEARIRALAASVAPGFDLARARMATVADGETIEYSYGPHRVKVYPRSGMMKYANRAAYNAIPPDFEKQRAVREERALLIARELVERLAAHGLIDQTEILWHAPHVYYRKLGEDVGGPVGGGRPPTSAPPRDMDTRVFLSRLKDGVPVSGHGVRIVINPDEKIASVNLMWRDVEKSSKTYRTDGDMARARQRFERALAVSKGARVDVLVDEFVYLDPSPRDPVAFLEPGFLFVYVVRTPLAGKPGVFAVSKKLHWFLGATEHGLLQVPSLRKARLKRLDVELPGDRHPEATREGEHEREGDDRN